MRNDIAINQPCEAVPAINLKALLTNCMGNASFALTLLEELESSGSIHVETIVRHAASADCAATAEAAHSLKGAAGIIGAEPLRSLAAKIELAGETADVESLATLVDGIRQEMERCLAQIPVIRQQTESAGTC